MNYFSKKLCALALLFAITNVVGMDEKKNNNDKETKSNKESSWKRYFYERWTDLKTGRHTTNAYVLKEGKKIYPNNETYQNKTLMKANSFIDKLSGKDKIIVNGKEGAWYNETVTKRDNYTYPWKETGRKIFVADEDLLADENDLKTNDKNIVEVETYTSYGWLNNTTQQVATALVVVGLCIWQKDWIVGAFKDIKISQK